MNLLVLHSSLRPILCITGSSSAVITRLLIRDVKTKINIKMYVA